METTTKIKAGGYLKDEKENNQFYYSIVIENQNNAPMPLGMAAEIAEMEQRIIEILKGGEYGDMFSIKEELDAIKI